MRILLITNEEWNDFVYGNGVLTNWFSGFNAEIAQIYTSPGLPINDICNKYFQITDSQMLKSIFGGKKAGGQIIKVRDSVELESAKENAQRKGIYSVMKRVSMSFNTSVQIIRDFIWLNGRYNTDSLRHFIQDFNPDIVFCPRYISPKLMRLERLVSSMTKAPFVAFTADDEASVPTYGSWLSRIRKRIIHKRFTEHISLYKHYFMFSQEQADEYHAEYGIETSTLLKCGDFPSSFNPKNVGTPIRLVYAGRLYCNRWKTLAEIGKALHEINKHGERMVLDIYTQEALTNEQRKALCPENSVYIKGSVNPQQLKEVYRNADIALHVESMDKKNRLATRVSFSTKIIDLMASSCAILAVCWNRHCGYQYLRDNDAAFCVDNYSDILPMLQRIVDNPSLVQNYAQKAYECGRKNHTREKVQKQIRDKSEELIAKRQANE